ncbi:hypothetical protein BE24_0043 [Staphylococcus phage vB_SepM_BE24]|nr:hypothetical protein BE24_0043 [Staphylococcus phage vB_SepM_BE24]
MNIKIKLSQFPTLLNINYLLLIYLLLIISISIYKYIYIRVILIFQIYKLPKYSEFFFLIYKYC